MCIRDSPGCVNTTGSTTFWRDTSIGVSVPTKNYNWKFGDPGSNALDSSQANPTIHTYPSENDYTVKLFVEDNFGCKGDTAMLVSIKIKPDIYFNALSNICENASPVSFASKVGCNNLSMVAGSGVFKGDRCV